VNLAILVGRFPPGPTGGAELQAERWATLLAERHRVTVVTRQERGGSAGRETRGGFEIVRLAVSPLPVLRAALNVTTIVRTVASLSPQPDVVLCFQTFVSGLSGVLVTARREIPAVVWVRGEDEYRLGQRRTKWISPAVWRRARGVLVQSETMRTELLAELGARSPDAQDEVAAKLEVVTNGLDMPSPPFHPGKGVLAVGRLVPQKGMDTVMDASAACGLPLTIVGEGPERASLETRQSATTTTFAGAVSRETLEQFYRRAGCVVLASSRGEGLPNVLLEAMAFARPVIATPIAGVRDLVRDEENGLLISPGDAPALAAALRRLEADPALAARLGAAGRTTAGAFSWESALEQLEPLLERWKR
jgi:colanic acid/amylovoran biosynthesis glycosyltransferase